MNGFNSDNDTSGYFEKIGSTTMFYKSTLDSRTLMIAGKNPLCLMDKIGQWQVKNVHDLIMHEAKELNTLSK